MKFKIGFEVEVFSCEAVEHARSWISSDSPGSFLQFSLAYSFVLLQKLAGITEVPEAVLFYSPCQTECFREEV